jgi:hypothetical protein
MLKGITLNELAAKITANAKAKQDFVADSRGLQMTVQSVRPVDGESTSRTSLVIPDNGTFPLQPLAHEQVGSFLKIPKPYYDRMLVERPTLLAQNVNTWLQADDRKRMVRTLHGRARAFLSNRYQRVDNNEIAEVALPVLFDLPGVQIVSSEVTEKRLYIHFVVPTVQGEVKRGDVVQAGGVISNSEVGCGSAAVSALRWRLLCLNGMKGEEAYRKYHAGRAIQETGEIDWADDTRAADDAAILLKIRDMVRAVVDETRFKGWLEKARGMTEGKITGDVPKAVEVLAQKIGVSDAERGGILTALIEGADLSRWGVINAVTAQAHKALNYDRAVEFESMGDRLIDLPKKDWVEVLEAA